MSIETQSVVIVGSGFGGSVVADRLAREGFAPLVLERGRAYPPGSFARTPKELQNAVWNPAEKKWGLYHFVATRGLGAITAAGLGGGSLIYANVLVRKPLESFGPEWPYSPLELIPHYELMEKVFRPQLAPTARTGNISHRTALFQASAGPLNHTFVPLPLGVEFNGPIARSELHQAQRLPCTECGECVAGCNLGSKNSTDYQLLETAVQHGAEIRTLAEVRELRPAVGGGYEVHYLDHQNPHSPTLRVVIAQTLVLCAGALNTTYLLLRNRKHFPNLSSRLGMQFNGNGDLLNIHWGSKTHHHPHKGPTITAALKSEQWMIEDVGYPVFITWLLEGFSPQAWAIRALRMLSRRLLGWPSGKTPTNLSADVGSLFAVNDTSEKRGALVSMGNETANGQLILNRRGQLQLKWSRRPSLSYYRGLRKTMKQLVRGWGGKSIDLMHLFPTRLTTVHPLGGCAGVVNSEGEVTGYSNLWIADGAVMPNALGVNPSLTIAAVASRTADFILKRLKGTKR